MVMSKIPGRDRACRADMVYRDRPTLRMCPVCADLQLEPLWDRELRWRGCAGCKGEWVDHDTLGAMFAERGQDEYGEPPVWLNQYDGLPCPECAHTMDTRLARRVAGDVTV